MMHVRKNNPYKGARAFETGETIFGRDPEIAELLDLVIAERIVLFHSPSGAGKTSLIQAGLIPALRKARFDVLEIIRVNQEPPPLEAEALKTFNRYVYSALVSLEEGRPAAERFPEADLRSTRLPDYLNSTATNQSKLSRVLIFDQFEEILTSSSTDKSAKEDFFKQVGEALSNRRCWALFAMREDYVAALSPYVRWIPTRFAATYRLDLLDTDAARLAIQEPALTQGVNFNDDSTDRLIDDLRTLRVPAGDGPPCKEKGLYVEPVQLQVVCYRLWEKLPLDAKEISVNDIETGEDVDQALAGYYAQCVFNVAKKTGISERRIREWFTAALITPQGLRGQVMSTGSVSQNLEDTVIRELVDVYLIRAEKRRNATWFELAHDRLIEPVQENNSEWFKTHLQPFQRQAALWAVQGRPDSLLLHDDALKEAEAWARAHQAELMEPEAAFLRRSRDVKTEAQKERERLEAQARKDRAQIAKIQILLAILAVITAVAVGAAFLVFWTNKLSRSRQLTMRALSELDSSPDRALLLSVEAYNTEATIDSRITLLEALHKTSNIEVFLHGHTGPLRGVALSPDGKIVASASGGELRLWDFTTHKLIASIDTGSSPIGALAFNHNGQLLITGNAQGTVTTWDVNTRNQLVQITPDYDKSRDRTPFGNTTIFDIVTGENNDEMVVQTTSGLSLWNLRTGAQLGTYRPPSDSIGVAGFAFMSSEKRLTAYVEEGQFITWEGVNQPAVAKTVTGTVTKESSDSRPHFGFDVAQAFSRDGRFAAVATTDGEVHLYDTSPTPISEYKIGEIGSGSGITALAFSGSGEQLAIGDTSGGVRVLNNRLFDKPGRIFDATPEFTASVGHNRGVSCLAFRSDGQTLVSGGEDAKVIIWRFGDLRLGTSFATDQRVTDVEFNNKDNELITCDESGNIEVRDDSGHLLRPIHSDPNIAWLDLSLRPSGQIVAAGVTRDNDYAKQTRDIFLWDAGVKKFDIGPVIGNKPIEFFSLSPDGNTLAIVLSQGPIILWDVKTLQQRGKALELNRGNNSASNFAIFNHRQTHLATTDGDSNLVIWDLASSSQITPYFRVKDYGTGLIGLAYSHDDEMVAAALVDRIILWNIPKASLEHSLSLYRGEIPMEISLNSDDKILAVNTVSQTTVLFDTDTGQRLTSLRMRDSSCESSFSPDRQKMIILGCASGGMIWDLDPESWISLAERIANRTLTKEELGNKWTF